MRILLVDLWNVFHVYWHAGVNKEAGWAFKETMGRCRALAREYDYCAFMADGGASFRKDLDSRWKKNREEKAAGLFAQLAETEHQLDVEGFHVFKSEQFEADDLIATAVAQLRAATWGGDAPAITINSSDRDLFALLDIGVEILWTVAPHKIVQAEHLCLTDKIGVDPPRMRDFLVLSDKHNGVKYFEDIGPKHAARLLNQFGDLKGILAAVDNRVPDSDQFEVHPPSVRASIKKALSDTVDGRPLIDVAVQICTLRTDAPIDIKTIFQKKAPRPAPAEWDDVRHDDETKVGAACLPGSGSGTRPDVGGRVVSGHEGDNGSVVEGDVPLGTDKASEPGVVNGTNAHAERVGQDVRGGSSLSGHAPAVVVQPMGGDKGAGSQPSQRASLSAGHDASEAPNRGSLVVAPRWELSLEPSSPAQAWNLAKLAHDAGFWQRHGSPAGCMMIIMAGRSRGLTAFDALNGMHIIEGKPVFGAYLLIGMVLRDKRCAYLELVESDTKHALWITKRKGSKNEQSRLYTIEDATAAGLLRPTRNGNPSNWEKHPEDLLIKTAGAKLTRAAWADVTSGAVAAEEMGYE